MSMRTSKRLAGTSLAVVDLSTGEILSDGVEVTGKAEKFLIEGGYAIVALVFFSKLAELRLPADAYRLAARIMASANFGGMVNKSNAEYAAELCLDRSRISRLVGKLHDAGVIHRLGPKTIFINPGYFFRGTPQAQRQAVAEWQRLRMPKLVGFQGKQKTA
jgi:hypothetical protein